MKHFRSEHAFEKYKPHVSWRKKLARIFQKKQPTFQTPIEQAHYKSNPFRAKKSPATFKFKIILLFILLVFWIACLTYLPYFKINTVDYTGLRNNTKQELDDVIYPAYINKKSRLPRNSYFLINTDRITKDLYEKFSFENVEVIKIFPDTLEIHVQEKISSIIYDNGKQYFLLDSGGTVIKYLTNVESGEIIKKIMTTTFDLSFSSTTTSSSISSSTQNNIISTSTYEHVPDNQKINKLFGNYPIVYDRRNMEISLNQNNVLPAQTITAVISWYTGLSKQGMAAPRFFTLDNLNSGIIIDTIEPWDIIFQPKNDTETQINTLKEILPSIKPKEYVDLRFGEKVYWK